MKNRKLEILWEKNLSLIRCQETEDKTHFVKKFLNIVSYYIPKFKHPHRKFFVFVPRLIIIIINDYNYDLLYLKFFEIDLLTYISEIAKS